jgi:hypothetical protein
MVPDDRPYALFDHHAPIVLPALRPSIIMNAVRQQSSVIPADQRLLDPRAAFGVILEGHVIGQIAEHVDEGSLMLAGRCKTKRWSISFQRADIMLEPWMIPELTVQIGQRIDDHLVTDQRHGQCLRRRKVGLRHTG